MKNIPALLLADFQSDKTSLAFIWAIELADGRMIRGTEHDQDIIIPTTGDSPTDRFAGHYYATANVSMQDIASTSDLSVDNLDVSGAAAAENATVLDVRVSDIESGLLDQAPVFVLVCNWRAPNHGYYIIKAGSLGTINHDSDGKYTTEVRGLTQALAQTIIRTFSTTCNVVKFGDVRCKINVPAITITGEVAFGTHNNRQQFEVTLAEGSPVSGFSYRGGILTFTSGQNAGFSRELKVDPNVNSGIAQFWEQFPEDIAPGDAFTLSPGCDRTTAACKGYNNLVNFRGYGIFIPGVNAITAGPTTSQELS